MGAHRAGTVGAAGKLASGCRNLAEVPAGRNDRTRRLRQRRSQATRVSGILPGSQASKILARDRRGVRCRSHRPPPRSRSRSWDRRPGRSRCTSRGGICRSGCERGSTAAARRLTTCAVPVLPANREPRGDTAPPLPDPAVVIAIFLPPCTLPGRSGPAAVWHWPPRRSNAARVCATRWCGRRIRRRRRSWRARAPDCFQSP